MSRCPVQSSEDPNPRPLQRTPLQAIPEEGFRTPAEATDEDVRLARRYQGYGGTRFVEDDLAGDPEAGALASNGQGPPSITDRLRSTADGAQAAADLIGAGPPGLAAAQAFRSQLPQDAAEYVRLNVLPRPGPAQPPPQIIGPVTGRGSARRRWSAARRPLRRRRPWLRARLPLPPRAWAEPLGTWGAWQKGPLPWRPPRARLLERWLARSWRGGNGGAGRGHRRRRSLRPRARHGLGAGEHALPAPAGQRGRGRAGRPVRQQHE